MEAKQDKQPLHTQHAVRALFERGADVEALDTYGMTPLHRMASNNLAAGAKALLVLIYLILAKLVLRQ